MNGWGLSLTSEFREIVAVDEQALAAAESAQLWSRGAAGIVFVGGIWSLMAFNDDDFSAGAFQHEGSSDAWLGRFVVTMVAGGIASYVSGRQLKGAVQHFNSSVPGGGAGLGSDPIFPNWLPRATLGRTNGQWAPGITVRLR